jgi:hypothetical protein
MVATHLTPVFADSLTATDQGSEISLTFFGPALPDVNGSVAWVPVAAVAIPRVFGAQVINAVHDALQTRKK